jgi:hypothetical protein
MKQDKNSLNEGLIRMLYNHNEKHCRLWYNNTSIARITVVTILGQGHFDNVKVPEEKVVQTIYFGWRI